MRWQDLRRSRNVEDRRDGGGDLSAYPSGGGGAMVPLTGVGGCGLLVVILVIALMGGDPTVLLNGLQGGAAAPPPVQEQAPMTDGSEIQDEMGQFASAILGSTEDVWSEIFQAAGAQYRAPKLVLFTDVTPTACGTGEAATGPFYCPGDENVYLDLGFLRDLQRLGATGDFAVAYVIAHEVGHHVQHLEGTDSQVTQMQAQGSRADANALSVLMELQADCYAGIWGFHANRLAQILEPGDAEEGLQAAASVGDDRLLRMAGRPVRREAFTHGSSEERKRWLTAGLDAGNLAACDTFRDAGLR
jgi:predicted metalloprotease